VEFTEHVEVFDLLVYFVKSIGPYFDCPDTFQDRFRLTRIVPKVGLMGDSVLICYFFNLAIVVKDTPSRQPRGPSSLSTVQLS
jgi:hypothetical protein